MPGRKSIDSTIFLCNIFFIFLLLFSCNGAMADAQNNANVIGAIMDVNTRIGKEQTVAMEIAIQDRASSKNQLVLQVRDSGGKPHQASTAGNGFTLQDRNKIHVLISF